MHVSDYRSMYIQYLCRQTIQINVTKHEKARSIAYTSAFLRHEGLYEEPLMRNLTNRTFYYALTLFTSCGNAWSTIFSRDSKSFQLSTPSLNVSCIQCASYFCHSRLLHNFEACFHYCIQWGCQLRCFCTEVESTVSAPWIKHLIVLANMQVWC
jgi:hypothetical protein